MYKPERPRHIDEKIKAYTKNPLPHFFKYAKDKNDGQVIDANNSFVNRLNEIIPNPRINCRKLGFGEIDYRLLMSNPDIEFSVSFTDRGKLIKEETEPLIVEYCELNKKYYLSIDNCLRTEKDGYIESVITNAQARQDLKFEKISNEIKQELSRFGYSESDVCDILVKFLYGNKKNKNKMALWLCYGDCILRNMESNFKKKTKDIQCIDCGEWFEVGIFDSATVRCGECVKEHKRELARLRKRKQREKEKCHVTL